MLLVAAAAGLALADSSVVALALPPILHELHTTVEGVAAVIGVYTLVLAVAIVPAAWLARRFGPGHAGAIGLLVFAAASLGCAAANDLTTLLVLRGAQAAGGAAGLLAAFDLIEGGAPGTRGRRLWIAAAVFGSAAGPAIGGVLTEALDWRAIFIAQSPLALAAAGAAWSLRIPPPTAPPSGPLRLRPALALALVAAALTAVLFLLVLELVAGWSVSPLRAAAGVTVLPVAAIAASRLRGDPLLRATAGCLLVAGGTAALAFLPGAHVTWTLAPQLLAGLGMGLAFPALAGELLPERTAADAARLLVARHVGIVAALLLLAPITGQRLKDATETAKLHGVALVLDVPLPPQDKITLAPALLAGVEAEQPRAGLQAALAAHRGDYSGDRRVAYDHMATRVDDTLVRAVGDAFRAAFLITAALALLAALVLASGAVAPPTDPLRGRAPGLAWAGASAAVALIAIVAYVALHASLAPKEVALRDPCRGRDLPNSGGITGVLQQGALFLLDRAACRYGSSREELVLALADDSEQKRFEDRHGVDPRSAEGILQGLLG